MFGTKTLTLAGSIAVIGANAMALSPIAGAVAGSFPGVDAAGVMKAAALYGLATALSALLLAPAIDRVGRRVALQHALLCLTIALMVSALAPSLTSFCFAQALAGLAAGCALPAIYALAAEISEKGRESRTLGTVLTGWTLSLVAGVSLSALVADFAHWRLVFAGFALFAGWLTVEVHRNRDLDFRAVSTRSNSPLAALRVRGVAPELLTVTAYMTAFYGLYAYLGAHLTGPLRLSTAIAGLASAAYGIGFGIAVFADRLLDRYGPAAAAPFAFLCLGLVYSALSAASARPDVLIVLCIIWGLANHIGLNLIVGRLTALDPDRRGAIMGLYSAVTYLSASAATAVYGSLYARFGVAGGALASAACIVVPFAMSLARARRQVTARVGAVTAR
jgi:predicted MFS family arabinose efflux permease